MVYRNSITDKLDYTRRKLASDYLDSGSLSGYLDYALYAAGFLVPAYEGVAAARAIKQLYSMRKIVSGIKMGQYVAEVSKQAGKLITSILAGIQSGALIYQTKRDIRKAQATAIITALSVISLAYMSWLSSVRTALVVSPAEASLPILLSFLGIIILGAIALLRK